MKLSPILTALAVAIVLLWVFVFVSYAHATLPQDSVIIVLKTAKVTLKKQVRSSTGAISTVIVGRYTSAIEAKEALRRLPPLKGGLMYRIDIPEAYANVVECIVPQGSICLDTIDHRLFIQ